MNCSSGKLAGCSRPRSRRDLSRRHAVNTRFIDVDTYSNVWIVSQDIFVRRRRLPLGPGWCLVFGFQSWVLVDLVEEFQDAVSLFQLDVGFIVRRRFRQGRNRRQIRRVVVGHFARRLHEFWMMRACWLWLRRSSARLLEWVEEESEEHFDGGRSAARNYVPGRQWPRASPSLALQMARENVIGRITGKELRHTTILQSYMLSTQACSHQPGERTHETLLLVPSAPHQPLIPSPSVIATRPLV